ncbi:hypothetical protein AB0N09_33555 [Streptomyces erythrochromogenes]|uniref:hypothetical protein n=1 Tax=Streptomyces erythrochromogenes TaxID=285574 RepID=UPI00341FC4ED
MNAFKCRSGESVDEVVHRRVSRLPWRLAVTAAAVTAAATVYAAAAGDLPGVLYVAVPAVALLPLLMREAPASFGRACLIGGMLLLWGSPLWAEFGLGPVVAAALLMLGASVADPDNPPDGASVAVGMVLPPLFYLMLLFAAW